MPIQLTPLEFDLLLALARRPWQVFSREVLLEQVWGYRHAADTRLVNVHVQRLRSKIERDPEHPEIVVTVRGHRLQGRRDTEPIVPELCDLYVQPPSTVVDPAEPSIAVVADSASTGGGGRCRCGSCSRYSSPRCWSWCSAGSC